MTPSVDIDAIMNQPERVRAWRRVVETVADRVGPLIDLSKPYVEGLGNLPSHGRFLLVGNHTQTSPEAFLIPYVVRRAIGMRVRPLTDRRMGAMPGPAGELLAACGAVVGAPETARELMRHNEPVLVFPGGGGRSQSSRVRSTACAGRADPDSHGCPWKTIIRSYPSDLLAVTMFTVA